LTGVVATSQFDAGQRDALRVGEAGERTHAPATGTTSARCSTRRSNSGWPGITRASTDLRGRLNLVEHRGLQRMYGGQQLAELRFTTCRLSSPRRSPTIPRCSKALGTPTAIWKTWRSSGGSRRNIRRLASTRTWCRMRTTRWTWSSGVRDRSEPSRVPALSAQLRRNRGSGWPRCWPQSI